MTATLSANDERIPLLQSKTIRTAYLLCVNRLAYSKNHLYAANNNTWNTRQHKRYYLHHYHDVLPRKRNAERGLYTHHPVPLYAADCSLYHLPPQFWALLYILFSFISMLLPTFLLCRQNFFISFNSLFRSFHPVKTFYNLFL